MKIFILTTTFFPQVGGAEYQVKWLAESLAERGHEVYLFTPYDAQNYIDKTNGFPKNIALRKRGSSSLIDAIRMFYTFIKWARKINPDIVHAHFAFSSGFLAAITKPFHKAPVIITSHGEDIQVVREINYGMRLKWYRKILIKLALKLCDAHTVVSKAMVKDAIDAGTREDKIFVIYNMYKPPEFAIESDFIDSVLTRYGIPKDKKLILSLSRLSKEKGLDYLIEAVSKLVSDGVTDIHLVIAGEGDERDNLENLVKKLNLEEFVTFTGYVIGKEKYALIKACDVYCMPSVVEAFGISLFDPMYYSKVIVASNDEAIKEVLGSADLIVPKKDPISLAKRILVVLENKKLSIELSNMCRSRIKIFMYPNVTDKYIKLYDKLRGGDI